MDRVYGTCVCPRVIETNEQKKRTNEKKKKKKIRKNGVVTRDVGGPSGYCANDYLEAR